MTFQIKRRNFLRSALVAGTATVFSACKTFLRTERTIPRPASAGSWTRHGIVLEASERWEGDSIQNFTTRAEPLSREQWRIWYSVSDKHTGYNIAFAEGSLDGQMNKIPALLSAGPPADAPLAIGNLPTGWKPVQPVHLRLQNGKHRLYFWAHGPQVCRYLAAESEDGFRYQVLDPLRPVLYHPNDRAAFGVPSPDGVILHSAKNAAPHEREPSAPPGLISNDATNVYQLTDGTFEMYSVALLRVPKENPAYIAEDNAPGLLRVIDRYTSVDGLRFASRHRVIQRGEADPVDQQFYYLSVTYTPRGRVGLLGNYRCRAQTMDLEWCFSNDGQTWQRPMRGPWLARGNPPSPDCYGIYAGSQMVYHDERWHLFYTGTNSSHNGRQSCGQPRQVIMYATAKSIWNQS